MVSSRSWFESVEVDLWLEEEAWSPVQGPARGWVSLGPRGQGWDQGNLRKAIASAAERASPRVSDQDKE